MILLAILWIIVGLCNIYMTRFFMDVTIADILACLIGAPVILIIVILMNIDNKVILKKKERK